MSDAWKEEAVRQAVTDARSHAEALRLLGFRSHGGNHDTLKRYIARWGISTDHFNPHWARQVHRLRIGPTPLEEILVEESTFHRSHLKERLFKEEVKLRICETCGQGESWRGRHMALILDHINGVPDDHRLENLRILCPNCAATLETHCGRKNGARLSLQACEACGNDYRPKNRLQKFCSRRCVGLALAARKKGLPQPALRKVTRPGLAEVRAQIEAAGWEATGRRYGVSGNAVRKWIRQYEREAAAKVTSAHQG